MIGTSSSYHSRTIVLILACFSSVVLYTTFQNLRGELKFHPPLSGSSHSSSGTFSPIETGATQSEPPSTSLKSNQPYNSNFEEWKYDAEQDGNNFHLNSTQCEDSFSGLFTEIRRATDFYKKSRIVAEDIGMEWKVNGAIRALIYDQQLYILESKLKNIFDSTRALSILHAINRAILTSPREEPVPDIEFSFTVSDIPDSEHLHKTVWSLTRTEDDEEKWIMSDFGYWSWPLDLVGSYEQVRREISAKEKNFDEKKKQVVWRGAVKTNKQRERLMEFTKHKPWADVREVRWVNATEAESNGAGQSYSGRGKYLQNCNSVVIIPKRKWIEPQHALLISSGSKQNFVEIESDFSDLEEKVSALLANPEKAKKIAKHGVETFRDRYLSPAAQACYWRKMFDGWAEVSFSPEEPGSESRQERPIPFETFV